MFEILKIAFGPDFLNSEQQKWLIYVCAVQLLVSVY